MLHPYLADARFWQFLYELDRERASAVRAAGCPHCAGVLHSARYPRKPRGIPRAVLGEAYWRRESLCCSREGCRRRRTPESVRFLGARVYLGALVVLVALRGSLPGGVRTRLAARFGVSERTLSRWRRWWREVFPATALWHAARRRFLPPVAEAGLPGSLLSRFVGSERERLVALLCLVRPLSVGGGARSLRGD